MIRTLSAYNAFFLFRPLMILGYKKALCFYPYLEFRSEVEVVGTTWRWEYLAGRLLLEWAGA